MDLTPQELLTLEIGLQHGIWHVEKYQAELRQTRANYCKFYKHTDSGPDAQDMQIQLELDRLNLLHKRVKDMILGQKGN